MVALEWFAFHPLLIVWTWLLFLKRKQFVNQFEIIYLEFELPWDLVGVFLGPLGLFNYSRSCHLVVLVRRIKVGLY